MPTRSQSIKMNDNLQQTLADLTNGYEAIKQVCSDQKKEITELQKFADFKSKDLHKIIKILQVQSIIPFSGEGQRGFDNYVTNLQKCKETYQLDDVQMRALSLAMSEKVCSDFLRRTFKENPSITWVDLLNTLRAKFELHTKQDRIRLLMTLKQNSSQTLNEFVENIHKLAEDVYSPSELMDDKIQKILVNIFVDGVYNDKIAKKLLRSRPNNLNTAAEQAHAETVLDNMLVLRENKPKNKFEINSTESLIPDLADQINIIKTKMEELTKKDPQPSMSNTNNTQHYQQTPQFHTIKPNYSQNYQNYHNPPFSKFRFTAEGKPICFYCQKEGHYQRDCYKKKREQAPTARYPRSNFNPRQNYNPRPNYNFRQNYNPRQNNNPRQFYNSRQDLNYQPYQDYKPRPNYNPFYQTFDDNIPLNAAYPNDPASPPTGLNGREAMPTM